MTGPGPTDVSVTGTRQSCSIRLVGAQQALDNLLLLDEERPDDALAHAASAPAECAEDIIKRIKK